MRGDILMKKLFLATSLVSLLFCVACGYGNGNNPFPPTTGNFNNASLSGHYAYQLTGIDIDTGGTFREAGVFTADGNGNITGGTDDLAQGSSIFSGSNSGNYSISKDGTGTVVINVSNGRGLELAVTLVNSSKLYLVVGQTANANFANGAGVAEKQDSSTFAAPPGGTFVFRMHSISALQGPSGSVGRFSVSGGVVTGNLDVNRGGASSSLTLTSGLFNSPDSNGRGTGSFTDSNRTSTFAYYVVDANNLRFFSTDAGLLGLGRAERQASTAFANASLSGGYAFGSSGETGSLNGVVKTVGRFTAGGDGTINDGAFDSAEEGTPFADIFIGTYNFDPSGNGRADVTLNPSNGSVQEVFWMVSPSRAFFLINDAGKVEDGTIDLQQSASFSNSTLKGQFAFVMDGTDPIDFVDRIGTLQGDGAGGVILSYFLDRTGLILVPPRVTVSGTYSVSSTINGRVTSSVDSLSNNLVFYLVSGNDAYILQNDTNTEIDGSMSKQP